MINTCRRIKAEDYRTDWIKEFYKTYSIADGLRPRKIWEFAHIMQVIKENFPPQHSNHIEYFGRYKALGFGVGREPISRWLGRMCYEVLATDNVDSGWGEGQIARCLRDVLTSVHDTHTWVFDNVKFRDVDMNDIPSDIRGFDFLWSCSSLEHIGGKAAGLRFISEAMKCLRPGGLAIHTTELATVPGTFDGPDLCLYNFDDFLSIEGLWPLDISPGHSDDDRFVITKYEPGRLGVQMQVAPGVVTTSVLLVVKKH